MTLVVPQQGQTKSWAFTPEGELNNEVWRKSAWSMRMLTVIAIASAILITLPWVIDSSAMFYLGAPFWAPGFEVAGLVFPQGMDAGKAYLVLGWVLNFLFTAVGLLIVVKVTARIFRRNRENG